MLIKGIEDDVEIEGFPVITEYISLSIIIDYKIKIIKNIDNINKKFKSIF